MGPGDQILNITWDVQQNCDFPGSPWGRVFFWGGGVPGPPGTSRDPRVCPSRTRGLSSMLRYATTLRFRIASLSNRFASSLRFRIASMNSLRFESLRFRIASLRIASLSNRFAFECFAFESLRFESLRFRIWNSHTPTGRRIICNIIYNIIYDII